MAKTDKANGTDDEYARLWIQNTAHTDWFDNE